MTRKNLRRALIASLAAAMLLLFAGIASPYMFQPGPVALNFVPYSPSLASSGMPRRAQFERIAQSGFQVVVNLVPPGALGAHADESALVERQGMRYYDIPVDFAAPSAEHFERFSRILRQHAGERVLVHCQLNLRASSFVFLHRTVALGEDPDRAYDDVLRVWQPAERWRTFMRETLAAHGKPLPLQLEDPS